MQELTFEIVNELVRLDGQTGRLYWRERDRKWFKSDRSWKSWNAKFAGKEAFTGLNEWGYRKGVLLEQPLKAHRVVWLLHTGSWPVDQIDHINGVRNDNRPVNLRDVSNTDNQRNMKRRADNTSGVNGVWWDKDRCRWRASIRVSGRSKHLGLFVNLSDAKTARRKAEKANGYHENHGRVA